MSNHDSLHDFADATQSALFKSIYFDRTGSDEIQGVAIDDLNRPLFLQGTILNGATNATITIADADANQITFANTDYYVVALCQNGKQVHIDTKTTTAFNVNVAGAVTGNQLVNCIVLKHA